MAIKVKVIVAPLLAIISPTRAVTDPRSALRIRMFVPPIGAHGASTLAAIGVSADLAIPSLAFLSMMAMSRSQVTLF